MPHPFKYRIIQWYCLIFYVLMVYKWCNGLLLYQIQPSFFYSREDIFTWLFMQTGVHQLLLNNWKGWILMDTLFYAIPLIYLLLFRINQKLSLAAAFAMLMINWVYVQCYTLYPTNSIEGHIAWLFFPFIFMFNNQQSFKLLLEGLRYLFLYLFISAGVWKFAQGGISNTHQMSGILLMQHISLLTNASEYWQSKMILYIIENPIFGYCLYMASALLELIFVIGFFTKKYDRWLVAGFLLFLFMDFWIMRIPYFDLLPLLLTMHLNNINGRSNERSSSTSVSNNYIT